MPKQKAAASGVSFSLGLLNIALDLVPAKQSGVDAETRFNLICEECEHPTKPQQVYICPEGHGPFTTGDITRRAKEVEGKLVEVTKEEVEEAKKTDVEAKTFIISVFPAISVASTTLPGDTVYRVRPRKDATQAELKVYNLILNMVSDTSKAFVGEVALKGNPKMARLGIYNGQLTLQTLIRPSDLAPIDDVDVVEVGVREQTLAKQLVESLTSDFDPDEYRNRIREQAAQLLAAKANGEATPVPKRKATSVDLADQLEAMLANTAT